MKTSSLLRQIAGRWRITEMEMWDSDYCDMEVEAFIEFGSDGTGTFQFGLVRSWAVLEGNRTITGRIFIHQGEDSSFRAEKKPGRRQPSGSHKPKRKTR